MLVHGGAAIARWLERRTRDRRENFLLQGQLCVLTLIRCVRSTPVLPQWHVKAPGHSAKSADGRLHLNTLYTLDPTKSEWADYAAVQA